MLQDLSLTFHCSNTSVLAEQEGDDDPGATCKLESPYDLTFNEFDRQMLLVNLGYRLSTWRIHQLCR